MKHDIYRITMCFGLILGMGVAFPSMAAPDEGDAGNKICEVRPVVRATDWVAAWQAARQACPDGDTVTLTFIERSGLRSELQKSASNVEISAAGEVVMVTIKADGVAAESVIMVRAVDLVRVEITRKASSTK